MPDMAPYHKALKYLIWGGIILIVLVGVAIYLLAEPAAGQTLDPCDPETCERKVITEKVIRTSKCPVYDVFGQPAGYYIKTDTLVFDVDTVYVPADST